MTAAGSIYLAAVFIIFLAFSITLAWASIASGGVPKTRK